MLIVLIALTTCRIMDTLEIWTKYTTIVCFVRRLLLQCCLCRFLSFYSVTTASFSTFHKPSHNWRFRMSLLGLYVDLLRFNVLFVYCLHGIQYANRLKIMIYNTLTMLLFVKIWCFTFNRCEYMLFLYHLIFGFSTFVFLRFAKKNNTDVFFNRLYYCLVFYIKIYEGSLIYLSLWNI